MLLKQVSKKKKSSLWVLLEGVPVLLEIRKRIMDGVNILQKYESCVACCLYAEGQGRVMQTGRRGLRHLGILCELLQSCPVQAFRKEIGSISAVETYREM